MHQKRSWKLFHRARCTCGLPWPCLELRIAASRRSQQLVAAQSWNRLTAVYQVGRAGHLTLAQSYRANGGRW